MFSERLRQLGLMQASVVVEAFDPWEEASDGDAGDGGAIDSHWDPFGPGSGGESTGSWESADLWQ